MSKTPSRRSSASGSRLRVAVAVGSVAIASALALSGCTSPAATGGPARITNVDKGAAQEISSSGGPTCNIKTYGAKKLDLNKITVGFSQSESTSNPFRQTETDSVTTQAAALGVKLIQRNANANVSQQNTDIENMIAQGAKALIVAPEDSAGIGPALAEAKSKHIPVLTIDRTVTGKVCSDEIGFIGSNFLGQAKIAADDLGTALNGKGQVFVLEGTSGNNVAADRTSGFDKEMAAKFPDIKIVASQTANFDQATGQKVTAQLLQANPGTTGIYAENDGMALGAIQAIQAAGKTPGTDIKIVSIDGIQQIVQDVVDGSVVADVETNPRFGPLAFQTLANFFNGKNVPETTIIKDHHFTSSNAKAALANGDVY
jgi:ABC-type sugar transport system substrate-binding protein